MRSTGAAMVILAVCAGPMTRFGLRAAEPAEISFAATVKPILARRCFACHGPDVENGGLRLHKHETALAELESGGRAIIPGRPNDSLLIDRVSAEDVSERMPPEGKPLTRGEIEMLRAWIAQGAEWEQHWAFFASAIQTPPAVEHAEWVLNPIDAFILAKLEPAELDPAPPADKRTLARRAYYGITGLPPTIEQLEEFLADEESDAWERLIDKTLSSPHYGEHWARHWLDLVRYAETNSFERDGLKPNAWKYRDYVIRSFNDDKPYDQFLREQLAGDELEHVTEDSIIATGYYRLGIWDDEPADPVQLRYDEWDDIISTTSQVMLGLTVGCARCHDHKIDPIPQADYYGLLAFFADVTPYGVAGDQETNSQWDLSSPEEAAVRRALREKELEIEREKVSMEEVGIKRMSAADQNRSETPERQQLLDEKLRQYLNTSEFELYRRTLERLKAARDKIRSLPPSASALALARCDAHPEPTHIMVRGNPHVPGELVEPHFPELFGVSTPEIPRAPQDARSAGRRRVLAEWIASPQNMLTARVIVNRVWQHHFGRGIIRSANNFGQLGTPPTHPELLDWLALWLIDHNWQLKPLHRLIMTSNAYRMSSVASAPALAVDPTNDLFWRFDMRRLSAEEIRDSVLMVTGEFNPKMYGPSFYPKLSQEVLATQSRPGDGWGESSPEDAARRSVYMFIKRSLLSPLHTAFDFPDVDTSCEARFVTVQPGQALALLNGEFANAAALKLADRVVAEVGDQPRKQIARALQLALERPPTDNEVDEGMTLAARLEQQHGLSSRNAFDQWCLVVLNLSEFIYVD
ncbi:MAG: PSD1 and planctomycete cytochrome C domain-containing protein [Pirellulales bacterium]